MEQLIETPQIYRYLIPRHYKLNTNIFTIIQSFHNYTFPSFSLPDVLCDPTDLIWMKRTPFEAMTGRTAPSSDGLLAEVFRVFSQLSSFVCYWKINIFQNKYKWRKPFLVMILRSNYEINWLSFIRCFINFA